MPEGAGRSRGALAAAFALGLLHAAGFAPLDHWTVPLAALAGLFALCARVAARGAGPGTAAALAAAFSIAWFGAGLSWLFVSMHTYGGMPAPMAALAVVLFAAYLSLYPVAATALATRVAGRAHPIAFAAAAAGAWTLGEAARGWVFTGFPWLAVGYGQIDGPLARLAPVAGVYGVGLVAVAVAALAGRALAGAALAGSGPAGSGPAGPGRAGPGRAGGT
ncbi:MAG TPA: apolipoprotein N-acyltransferase, partial [Burkholderiaceae bacterium]|nr:apolipoprotein N-acyltransferase [Burkholderiaceae bacterium]